MKKLHIAIAAAAAISVGTGQAALVSVTSDAVTGGNAASVTTLRNDNSALLTGPAGDSPGSTWNIISGYSATNLLDSTGAATSIGFTTTYNERRGITNLLDLELARTYYQVFGKGADNTLTINGLEAGGLYNVWLVSVSNAGGAEGYAGTWSTTNTTTSASSQLLDSTTRNTSTFVQGQNMVYFENVEADGSGEISFLADAGDIEDAEWDAAYRLGMNGFQIESVIIPEPSSLALLGLGLGGLLLRRRRN